MGKGLMAGAGKANIILIVAITGLIGITTGVYFAFNSNEAKADTQELFEVDPGFANYISTFTSGMISSESIIQIQLDQNVLDSFSGELAADEGLFDFEPSIKGAAFWTDARTIEFRPEEPLPYNQAYRASLELAELIEVTEKDFRVFEFGFKTYGLHLEVETEGISYYEDEGIEHQKIEASIQLSDRVDSNALMNMFSAYQEDRELPIKWLVKGNKEFQILIDEVERLDEASEVILSYDGDIRNASLNGKKRINVPAAGDFSFLSGKIMYKPGQYVLLRFSDPLDSRQDLEGLIHASGVEFDLKLEGNEIHLFPTSRQAGSVSITIESSIRNRMGHMLGSTAEFQAVFEQLDPDVRWVGEGNIIPSSDQINLPFEAVGLEAVDVEIVQIFESNVAQFFQTNKLDENDELRRVGRPILRKTISLRQSGVVDLNKWNRFELDLSSLIQTSPGAIYQVHIDFRMSHSLYKCPSDTAVGKAEMEWHEEDWDSPEGERSYWNYYSWYSQGYEYRERDNPCHISYYLYRKGIKRNVMASDIGVIARKGKFNNLHFAVTRLNTANPLGDANIRIINYQQQEMLSLTTDGDGMASCVLDDKPFLAIVSKGSEKAYLRIDDYNNLSLSHFNTSGQESKAGFKGFIYGERGVWRPGDSLYLSFMLEDPEQQLPAGHPIVLELEDPYGKIHRRQVRRANKSHHYAFRTNTDEDAATGTYVARVHVGDNVFTKNLPIETIKPNRLKINLDFEQDKITAGDQNVSGRLSARWLHGAKASKMKAQIEAILVSSPTEFEEYPDFIFDDQARNFESEHIDLFDGILDEDGEKRIDASISINQDVPGRLLAQMKTRVFEHSGNASVDFFTIPYHHYNGYLGLRVPKGDRRRGMLLTDTTHRIDLVAVNTDGKPESGTKRVSYKLWKLNWRWWWDQSNGNISNYVFSSYHSPVKSGYAEITNGKGNFDLRIDRPEWGRYYLRVTDPVTGHSTGKIVYIDWPGWAGKPQQSAGVHVLNFETDKNDYTVGETANVKITNTAKGRALVSLENASKVLRQFWIETGKGETEFELDIEKDMTPNCYLHISMIQPNVGKENDLPIRLYGISNINVRDPGTILQPEIKTTEVYRPETDYEISVSEASGKEMTYTLAVVDEGLLDLTRFNTPDPRSLFYAKQALGVSAYDMYDYVLGTHAGEMSHVLGLGGGIAGNAGEESKMKRFEPVVQFLGPFKLKKGQKTTHKLKMPNYIGSVRVMVVAREGKAYGNAEKAVPVRSPLMVLSTAPRVLGPGEEFDLPVSVFAMEKQIKKAKVSLEAGDLFEIVGSSSQQLNFSEPGEKFIRFRLRVKEKTGKATIKVNAKSGGESSYDETHMTIRNPNPYVSKTYSRVLEGGKSARIDFAMLGMKGSNSGIVEASLLPPIELGRRLKYLMRYPHGCIEQTTSSVFPQLFLADIMELEKNYTDRIDFNIEKGIQRILSMQNADGGFGYWPGALTANEWGTNYAGHFLLEAKNKGYRVSRSAINNWKAFQRKLANQYSGYGERQYHKGLTQAYRLYTLALAGSPEIGAMNRLRNSDISLQAKWRLAAAYALIGQKESARELIRGLDTNIPYYREMSYTFGSSTRDMAMILEALVIMDDQLEASKLMRTLAGKFNARRYHSTQTTAYTLLAASKYALYNKSTDPINFEYSFGSNQEKTIATNLPMAQVNVGEAEIQMGYLNLKNNRQSTVFINLMTEGKPLKGDTTRASNNLEMEIIYKDMEGNPIQVNDIVQGMDFTVDLSVKNPGSLGDYKEMALTQVFPSGWEIINTRIEGSSSFYNLSKPTYQDYRDDRVYTYFDLDAGHQKTFRILLNASYCGKFYLPPFKCEAMYDNEVSAYRPGQWVNVLKERAN